MSKLSQAEAGYIPAALVPPEGTSCGACYKMILPAACIEVEGHIDASQTCIVFQLGTPMPHSPYQHAPAKRMTQAEAGYGPGHTRCGNCEYFHGPDACERVQGYHLRSQYDSTHNENHIEPGGCCNLHEFRAGGGA